MVAFWVGVAAFFATTAGGALAFVLRDRLHLILGFSAGAVIGVVFFDLLPETLSIGAAHFAPESLLGFAALGFLAYLLLDRLLLLHHHSHEEGPRHARGKVRAASLLLHSLLDGVGMGLAFHVSTEVGIVVALAVLAHDFSDGINTVGLVMRDDTNKKNAVRWLLLDAVAPVCGVALTFFFSISEAGLAVLLALFSGSFLYIGASDLVPESHHAHPTFWTSAMTVFGAGLLFVVIHLAGV